MKALFVSVTLAAIALSAPASAQAVWDQIPPNDAGTTIVSQDFESSFDAYDSSIIDDFTLGGSTQLTSLDALLQGFNGGESHVGDISNFTVNIYSSVAKAASGLAGDVFSGAVPSNGVTITDPFGTNTRMVHVPFSATLPAGQYYVGLLNRLDFSSGGEVGVLTWGNGNATLANPGGGFGLGTSMSTMSIGGGGNASYRLNGAAVPEPATWAMMVAGVGVLGGMLRSNRRKALAAA